MRASSMTKSQSGFTLIEMMIAVAVICILTIIGYPSFRAIIRSNRISAQTNSFLASVSLARGEAIKNNFNAGLCASTNGTACGGTWVNGWMVFDDNNNNGVYDGGAEKIIRYTQGDPNMAVTTATAGPLMFNQRGMYTGNVPITIQMAPLDCATGYQGVRNFTLLPVGQLTVTKANCP
jgi:type IV fimbrial biogenesis protein FimT